MERILVAVDEDPMREHVVRKADEVAHALGATMLICHVLTDEEYGRVKGRLSYSEAAERAASIGEEAVSAVGDPIAHYRLQGAIGEPSEELLRLADELNAGMIVMGFAGLHGFERLKALGSVSRAVMESTTRPVLIVPRPG